jgi:YHS domain-containing protein
MASGVEDPNSLEAKLERRLFDFYETALIALTEARLPFLVGGAYALAHYTGIVRHTKDLDIFVRPADCKRALQVLAEAGYRTEWTSPHWIAKAFYGEDFIDIIFSSGNGLVTVDDAWFACAVEAEVLGRTVKVCPPEETLWSKAYVMERERYDGADIAHLLRAQGAQMDWPRLLRRFGPHWQVLLSHLILFGFIYPSERTQVPAWVWRELLGCVRRELRSPPPQERICQGTLLSKVQYLIDIESWGYVDARLSPRGVLTQEQTTQWTAFVDRVGEDMRSRPRPRTHSEGGEPMAKDPVCGMQVDEQRAAGKREYQGETFYFCSADCLERFDENPHRYADLRTARTIQPDESGPCTR